MSYDLGDGVYLRHEVRDSDGALINATVSVTVTKPSGSTLTPAVSNIGVGTYDAAPVITDEIGVWNYAWHVAGSIVDEAPGYFVIGDQPDRLATAAELATMLGAGVDDDQANLLIESATAVIQAITGQRLVQVKNDVVVLDIDEHDGGTWLHLPQRPVTDVSAVSIGNTALATPNDYTVSLSRARIWRSLGWRSTLINYYDQPSTVTVTYTHGYPVGHPKLALARAAALGLAKVFVQNPTGASRITIDDYTEAYEAMSVEMTASSTLASALRREYGKPAGSVKLIRG